MPVTQQSRAGLLLYNMMFYIDIVLVEYIFSVVQYALFGTDTMTDMATSASHSALDDDIKPDMKSGTAQTKKRAHRRTKQDVDSDGDTKPAKDLNAPKKPMLSYNLFAESVRRRVQAENVDKSVTEVTSMIGAQWRAMTEQQKQPFVDRARKLREDYDARLTDYHKTPAYKEWVKAAERTVSRRTDTSKPSSSKTSLVRHGDIPIFSSAFIEYNKSQETKLRQIRTRTNEVLDEQKGLRKRLSHLREVAAETASAGAGEVERTRLDTLHTSAVGAVDTLTQHIATTCPSLPAHVRATPADRLCATITDYVTNKATPNKTRQAIKSFLSSLNTVID